MREDEIGREMNPGNDEQRPTYTEILQMTEEGVRK